ncbi:MAG: Cna B domain-containing protein [Elusimicrobia bacterium]|nr:MAG: Cna B domain-containing protein [Elusimicrobiota bacterium]KAF0157695.1 MAG: Cna B domain-containing protein [Elusimicrobiota bacterium]
MPKTVFGKKTGVTLVELLVAMTVITIGVVAGMGAFRYINEALAQSRLRTIATNLAQEKMEVLKNKSYFQLLVTTAPAVSTGYDPNFLYDTASYPPEYITLWGMPPLTRAVNVDYASVSGTTVSTVPYSASDPGMKRITVYVYWTDRGKPHKTQIDSYYQNPDAATLSAGFNGTVTEGGVPAQGVLVQVVGAPKWRGYSNASGNYSFQVAPGTYTLSCSSAGYYAQTTPTALPVTQGVYTARNFSIVKIGTGTIASNHVYAENPGLVISQVVASTVQAGGFDAQYIELFNPTSRPVNIGVSPGVREVRLNYTSRYASQLCTDIPLVYVSTFVPSRAHYLIANTPSFTVGGVAYSADAYYTDTTTCVSSPVGFAWTPPSAKPILMYDQSGTVWLTNNSGGTIDAVGWRHGTDAPSNCETSCIATPAGLKREDQIVRLSEPCSPGNTYGRAYDSGNNVNDFYYNLGNAAAGLAYVPFNKASGARTVRAGVPATGAYILADDGMSSAVRSSTGSMAGAQGQVCPVSSFTLVGVATGTWNLTAVHGGYMTIIASVAVTQNAVIRVPNASTFPAWPAAGLYYTVIASTYSGGLATGFVYGAGSNYWTRLPGQTVCSTDGNSITTDSQGWYFLSVSTGTAVITGNCGLVDGNYSTDSAAVTINQGEVTSVPDLHLPGGGYIRGYITSGTGALPNIPVTAKLGGNTYSDTSDITGHFNIFAATSTLGYEIEPELDSLQSFISAPTTPLISSVTVPGATVFAGTITVIGAMGTVTGAVSFNGAPITTGVLIVASTATVPHPLPVISASAAGAGTIYYSASSKSDGTYALEVRSSTSAAYNLRAFYPVVDDLSGTVSYTSKTSAGVAVGAGATVLRDFSWP